MGLRCPLPVTPVCSAQLHLQQEEVYLGIASSLLEAVE